MGNVIEVSGLRKSFGWARALDGLDLSVSPGEVHAFLGPNGWLARPPPDARRRSRPPCWSRWPPTSSSGCWSP
jgi:hypothetical protein